jgi:aminopeptidase N
VFTALGKRELGRHALNVTVKALPFYEQHFGIPYPLEKLDLVTIPDFAAGISIIIKLSTGSTWS